MAKHKRADAAVPYLRRIAEDEYVQKQLREAATRLREVYSRGSRERSKAAEDKQLYRKVREAATSVRKAVGAIEEPPPKPKRHGRSALLFAFAVSAVLLAKRATKRGKPQPDLAVVDSTHRSERQEQESGERIAASPGL